MSTPSTAPKMTSWGDSYVKPALSAAGAVIPTAYGFSAKNNLQLGLPLPKISLNTTLRRGLISAPILAMQAVGQSLLEQNSNCGVLVNSVTIGAGSIPAMVTFNGVVAGKTITESLRGLDSKQSAAIFVRETAFLYFLRLGRGKSSESKDYAFRFALGAASSALVHPADTALALWQNGVKQIALKTLYRGCITRATTVGCFSVCYHAIRDGFDSFSRKEE